MRIVEVTQLVKVEYLVDANNNADAIKSVRNLDSEIDFAELPGSVFIKNDKYEARKLTKQEESDFVVQRAISQWRSDDKEPEKPVKKKSGRPKKSQTAEAVDALLKED